MPDLDAIPGLTELQEQTTGDPRLLVAVIDGRPVMDHPSVVEANVEVAECIWIESGEDYETGRKHATGIVSILFGQPGTSVEGIAPDCRGLVIPVLETAENVSSPLVLAGAIDLAVERGAKVIHCAACQANQSGDADGIFAQAVRHAAEQGVVVIAPCGNQYGRMYCAPACLPGAVAVGALAEEGTEPVDFSDWGDTMSQQGILAPGQEVLVATVDGEVTRQKGTSVAAPIVSGVASLLCSLMIQRGLEPDGQKVRHALLESARPLPTAGLENPDQQMRGVLNLPGAIEILLGAGSRRAPLPVRSPLSETPPTDRLPPRSPLRPEVQREAEPVHPDLPVPEAQEVKPSIQIPARVFAIGSLGYDFGSDARLDSFRQSMPGHTDSTGRTFINPHDPDQMIDHLIERPNEAHALIWTLNLESTPIYAIRPVGPYAADVYRRLCHLLGRGVLPRDDANHAERISLPGTLTDETVTLRHGEVLPVVKTSWVRGLYGWNTGSLVRGAIEATRSRWPEGVDESRVRRGIEDFLGRVYYDMPNEGKVSRDRALNFAVTNTFQSAESLAEAVARGMTLETIDVDSSPFCRSGSDCWDVKLKFFDPENSRRARWVLRYTIDVSDAMPVTMGPVRKWSVSS